MDRRRRLPAAVLAAVLVVAACSGPDGGGDGPANRSQDESAAETTATPVSPTPRGLRASATPTTRAGNGGYDVGHYALDLAWDPDERLRGTATLTVTATQDLSSFSLDLADVDVSAVMVDGADAPWEGPAAGEMTVTPARPLAQGPSSPSPSPTPPRRSPPTAPTPSPRAGSTTTARCSCCSSRTER